MHLKTFLLAVTLAVYDLANCLPNLDTVVKNKNLKCNSIGRFADPIDCGSYYDCVPSDNGELVAHQKSCMGLAYNPELKNCLPIHMVQGCIPYATRSFNIVDPTLEHLCRNKDNQFLCSDCKTMVLCVDGKSYTDPCSNGTQCSMKSIFGGGVCYPDDPIECTCNKPDIYKQDFYDLSKFLSCGPEGSDPIIHSCPNGYVFNEERGSCCTENGSECTPSGASLNKEDCTRYSTFILTIGGWIQKEYTCKNKTMFNEDTGNCEDPCKWYSGNFTCQKEGRFSNPSNCRQFFECILDPFNSDSFTQIEHECPKGYSWNQIIKGGHCVPMGNSKENCVPQKQKPKGCKIPNEWCPVPTTELCSKDGGSCIRNVDHCDGTINLFSNSINDHCICCITVKDCGQVVTPVNGFLNETGTMFGDSLMFGCEDGYNLDGDNEAKCLSTGNWSKAVPQCKIKNCGEVEAPVNGFVDQESGTMFGDSITFRCEAGYDLDGANETKCLATGKWSQVVPQCKIKNCGEVEAPVNGFVDQESGTMFGDSITFRCEAGYDLDGANETKCLATGKWSQVVPQCKITKPVTKVGCETLGAQMIGGQCLYFSPESDGRKTWDDAVVACTKKGGALASLEDPQAVKQYAGTNSWGGHVGATDAAEEGTWLWLNGQQLGSNFPWAGGNGRPPHGGSSNNCLYVNSDGYHDFPCALQYRYICDLGGVTKPNIKSEVEAPAANSIISNTNIPECVSPWIYAGHSTGCLLVTQQSMDWHSAQAYCNSMGGHLPLLDRESKHIDMMEYYQRSGLENVSFWLGANDNSGSLLWVNGMPVRDGWKYTQSKVDQGEDMCLYTYLSGQNGDPPLINYCSHLLHNIICQKKVM